MLRISDASRRSTSAGFGHGEVVTERILMNHVPVLASQWIERPILLYAPLHHNREIVVTHFNEHRMEGDGFDETLVVWKTVSRM